MEISSKSVDVNILENNFKIDKNSPDDKIIALAGNPNVGKSTVFNHLTGLKQHTGNWPGKTVTNAQGRCNHKGQDFIMVDLPGTYSLMSNSLEEEVARDFICFGDPDATVIVADATCLERNLNLVLQTLEITRNVVLCVNLIDEAEKKQIKIDVNKLSNKLGIQVIGTSARSGIGMNELMDAVKAISLSEEKLAPLKIDYDPIIEQAVEVLEPYVKKILNNKIDSRWITLKMLDGDDALIKSMQLYLGCEILNDQMIAQKLKEVKEILQHSGIDCNLFRDKIVTAIVHLAEAISRETVVFKNVQYDQKDRKIDRILTSKIFGIPIMIGLLGVIFWITITGANYPSALLSDFFSMIETHLTDFFVWAGTPPWVHGLLVLGVYKTLAWVVSVMLPPMAIFFPLFTLLEDLGYLPRIAFNLDNFFKKACTHGKQALTMCMGFGCNAVGVIGCRIIDSPRERLIATITNSFVPCNGRFPTLIAISTMFFALSVSSAFQSVISTLIVTGIIVLGVCMTLLVSKILSKTILKGIPSSFTLELPPYRKPQIGKVIIRSVLDRTIFVLSRAVVVAAPAGLLIWSLANIHIADVSILAYCINFLDPFAKIIGLDGVILIAFILGFPANEIVFPIIIMGYMSSGNILELDSLVKLRELLIANGWTWLTAVCTMLFSLMHWPCGTTCWTIKKETQSFKWTAVSFIIPTATGLLICFLVASAARLLGIA